MCCQQQARNERALISQAVESTRSYWPEMPGESATRSIDFVAATVIRGRFLIMKRSGGAERMEGRVVRGGVGEGR